MDVAGGANVTSGFSGQRGSLGRSAHGAAKDRANTPI
jgi:hypothetical protein